MSLSLPLRDKPYLDDESHPYFANLLPEEKNTCGNRPESWCLTQQRLRSSGADWRRLRRSGFPLSGSRNTKTRTRYVSPTFS
ncbi:MAG: HipA N-terminal domain-containing protein [Deltaproteobacteria bacterium]|nr:HipA N-terminal domain-containing protein [Deltaproteobacteria bacterium]